MIGNFSTEVKQPKRNIPLAVILSSVVVILVSVLVALAVQRTGSNGTTIIQILTPLYGNLAKPIISVITIVLCLSTYLTVIGSVTRLIASSTSQVKGLSVLSYRNKQHMPIVAILVLFSIHIIVLVFVSLQLLDVQKMVAVANAFFLCNACFGIAAAFKLIHSTGYKLMASIVFVCFVVILAFSSLWVICCIGAMIIIISSIHLAKKKTAFSQM